MAMTGKGANDTPVQSQSQSMRAAGREPAGGATPVALAATSRLMNSQLQFGVPRTNRIASIYESNGMILSCRLTFYIDGIDRQIFVKEVNM